MPHLVQMDKRYGKEGLTIIGAEVQNSSKSAVKKIADRFKIKFPLTKGARGPVKISGIPAVVAFDASGQLIFTGRPGADLDRAVKKALHELKKISGGGGRKSHLPEVAKPLIEQRIWENLEGHKITASVLSISESEVEFKMSTGKKVHYTISKLSESDQKLIKETSDKKDED